MKDSNQKTPNLHKARVSKLIEQGAKQPIFPFSAVIATESNQHKANNKNKGNK